MVIQKEALFTISFSSAYMNRCERPAKAHRVGAECTNLVVVIFGFSCGSNTNDNNRNNCTNNGGGSRSRNYSNRNGGDQATLLAIPSYS